MHNILLVDAGHRLAEAANHIISGAQVVAVDHAAACMQAVSSRRSDLIILEQKKSAASPPSQSDRFSVLETLRKQCAEVPILVLLDPALEPRAAEVLTAGATEFLVSSEYLSTTLPLVVERMFRTIATEYDQRALKKERDQLKRAHERKHEFIAVVTHDLRAPLLTLRIYTQFLAAGRLGNLTSAQKEKIELILRSADRMAHSIESIQRYERLEAPQLELVRTDFDLKSLFMDVISAVSRPCMEKGITLVQSFPPGAARVHADRELILESTKELVENAVAHTANRGSITLAITEGDSEYTISVTDSGCGINSEQLAHIFESAWQSDTEPHVQSAAPGQGLGLGLATVKRIMDMHHTHIEVNSEPGRGTRVRFKLPLSNTNIDLRNELGTAGTRIDQFKRVILIVDDDQDNLACARSVLEFAGYNVLGANGYDEARQQLAGEKVDAVLLDYAMSGTNGLEVLRRLKQDPSTSDVPVIMVSGCSDDKARASAARMGAAAFIVKPFMPFQLLKELAIAVAAANSEMPLKI
jgi:signal transduction histidine kinase/ActR/RegA family two-component response regulator